MADVWKPGRYSTDINLRRLERTLRLVISDVCGVHYIATIGVRRMRWRPLGLLCICTSPYRWAVNMQHIIITIPLESDDLVHRNGARTGERRWLVLLPHYSQMRDLQPYF